jgi:protein TonB
MNASPTPSLPTPSVRDRALAERVAESRRARLVGGLSAVVGLLGMTLLNLSLASTTPDAPEAAASAVTELAPPPKDPPKPPPRPSPPPKARPKPSAAPPAPALGASLAGLDLSLLGLGEVDLGAGQDAVGDVGDVVMTEDSVDSPPQAIERQPAAYPAKARAKGITGYVVLRLRVGADGMVQDVQVQEATPPGVFEETAVTSVRGWRFEPATYEGRPVTVQVTQTVRFELSG